MFFEKGRCFLLTEWLLRVFAPGHPDDPAVRGRAGKLAGVVGVVCNTLLFLAKLLAGLLSGSVSVAADAVNNLSDAASSVVTLVGFRLSEKPADEEHPFGHARMEYLAGLAVAVMILLIGVELAKTGIDKILHPQPMEFGLALAVVLVLSVLLKLWLAAFNRRVGGVIGSATLVAAAADSRNDVLATLAVLAAAALGHVCHINLDGWMGLAVALFILYSGVGILKDTVDPLLGEAPTAELTAAIAKKLHTYPGVLGIHDLIVHDYGPGRRFASVHVEMDSTRDVLEAHDQIDNIERQFATDMHLQLVIHYDPIVVGDPLVDEMHSWTLQLVQTIDPRLRIHDFRVVPGATHTNLIFDVVRPRGLEMTGAELAKRIRAEVHARRPDCYAVPQVDENYLAVE